MASLRKRDEMSAATWAARVQADGHGPSPVVTSLQRKLVRWLAREATATLVTLGDSVVQRWWLRMQPTRTVHAHAKEPERTPT